MVLTKFALFTYRKLYVAYIFVPESGGENALNIQRTIKDLIAAGAAGCFLEVNINILLGNEISSPTWVKLRSPIVFLSMSCMN